MGVSEVSSNRRGVKEVKTKWNNVKQDAKSKAVSFRKEFQKTGGGINKIEPLTPAEEMVVSIIGDDSIAGVEGGIDTLSDPVPVPVPVCIQSTSAEAEGFEEAEGITDEGKTSQKENENLKSIKKKRVRQMDDFEKEYLRLKNKQVKYLKKMYKWQKVGYL